MKRIYIILGLITRLIHGQTISCKYSGEGSPACDYNLDEWNNGVTDAYDCANGVPPINITTAATTTAVRKNVENLTASELHTLLYAMTCAISKQDISLNNSGPGSWTWVGSTHGEPGWFPQCRQSDPDRGLVAPGCCSHGSPGFVTWHRILMVQYDNSLKQWDLNAFSPYWDWINYVGTDFPELLRNGTIYDTIIDKRVQNPFYNYLLPNSVYDALNASTNAKCNYTCRDAQHPLFSWMNSANPYESWYKQVLQSYFYDYFVPFDYMFEIPHNNMHNLIGGNMPNLWTVMGDPIFMFHHSQVERLFLIWQKMLELRGINYTNPTTQSQYMGCFVSQFKLNKPILPFWNDDTYNYNPDPIGAKFSESPQKAMDYSGMYYEYDTLNFGNLNLTQLQNEISTFHTNKKIFLGFNYNRMSNGYNVHYNVTRFGETTVITTGFFSILANMGNPWYNKPKYLYRMDITDALKNYGINEANFENEIFDVHIRIDSDAGYTQETVGVFHPTIIYRDGSTGREIHNIMWGDTHDYNDASFMFGTDHDYINHSVRLIYPISLNNANVINPIHANTMITYYDKNDDTYGITHESVPGSSDLLFYSDNTYNHNAYSYTLLNYYTQPMEYGNADQIDANKLYAFGRNKITQQSSGINISINIYPNQDAWQGHSSYEMFRTGSFPTTKAVSLSDGASNAQQGSLHLPWSSGYIGSNLYDTTYEHQFDLSNIQFLNCPNSTEVVCQVLTATEYDNCDFSKAISCGVNIDASLTFNAPDQTYYFISNEPKLCIKGFKVAVHVQAETINPCTALSGVTNPLIAKGETSINNKKYTITMKITPAVGPTAPQIQFTVTGPSDYTWWGWGLFGPWTKSGGVIMKGIAAIYVDGQPNDTNMYYLQGSGVHSKTGGPFTCTVFSDENNVVTCTSTQIQFCQEWLQYDTVVNDTKIKVNVTYYGRFAYLQDSSAPGFNIAHQTSPTVFPFTFQEETITEEEPTTTITEADSASFYFITYHLYCAMYIVYFCA
eukprot:156622_1